MHLQWEGPNSTITSLWTGCGVSGAAMRTKLKHAVTFILHLKPQNRDQCFLNGHAWQATKHVATSIARQ